MGGKEIVLTKVVDLRRKEKRLCHILKYNNKILWIRLSWLNNRYFLWKPVINFEKDKTRYHSTLEAMAPYTTPMDPTAMNVAKICFNV